MWCVEWLKNYQTQDQAVARQINRQHYFIAWRHIVIFAPQVGQKYMIFDDIYDKLYHMTPEHCVYHYILNYL